MRILVIALLLACKGDERPPPAPRTSTLPALPAGPAATIDPADKPVFPAERPAIVVWQGGGEPPRTLVSMRIWTDGSVRFGCNRRGTLPPERVAAMLDTFERAGWLPASGSVGPDAPADSRCITTSVQIMRGDRSVRRDVSCEARDDSITDALAFVQSVVGPDPCK